MRVYEESLSQTSGDVLFLTIQSHCMAGISLPDVFSLKISLQDIFFEITLTPPQNPNGRPLSLILTSPFPALFSRFVH